MLLASIWQNLLAFLFVTVGLLMIGIILLQKNRGAGLSGAFGGVGGHSAFGTKTGDFLTWVTVGFTAALMLLAIVGNFAFQPASSQDILGVSPVSQQQTTNVPAQSVPVSPQPVPVAPPASPTPVIPGGAATPPASPAPANPAPPAGAPSDQPQP
jgi:preprotein translocase subunit SecG